MKTAPRWPASRLKMMLLLLALWVVSGLTKSLFCATDMTAVVCAPVRMTLGLAMDALLWPIRTLLNAAWSLYAPTYFSNGGSSGNLLIFATTLLLELAYLFLLAVLLSSLYRRLTRGGGPQA